MSPVVTQVTGPRPPESTCPGRGGPLEDQPERAAELLRGSTGREQNVTGGRRAWAGHSLGKGCRAGDALKLSRNGKKEFSAFFCGPH